MGMIYKRGNVWWIKYYRNGKSFRESSKSTKKMVSLIKSPLMNWPMDFFGTTGSTRKNRLSERKGVSTI